MNVKSLMQNIINFLPVDLKKDNFFKKIVKEFFSLDTSLFDEYSVTIILGEYFQKWKRIWGRFDFVNFIDVSNSLCSLNVTSDDKDVFLSIAMTKDGDYSVSFEGTHKSSIYYNVNINYEKKIDRGKAVIISSKYDDNVYYDDYEVDIRYFDCLGNEVEETQEDKKDEIFSKTFYVPISKASLYRNNFQLFKGFLNESRVKGQMNYLDREVLNKDNGLVFRSPCFLVDLEDFIKEEYMNPFGQIEELEIPFEEDEADSMDEDYFSSMDELDDFSYDQNKFQLVRHQLVQQIGLDGEVVFSDNLFTNIISYISNSRVDVLCTKGIIVKKVDGYFTIYYVAIENGQMMVMSKAATEEEAQSLYYGSKDNERTKGLASFFQIERGRH